MFKIDCFVTDKHLPDVLRALGQRVMNLQVVPVVGAEPDRGKKTIKPKPNSGNSLEAFLDQLRKAPAINKATAEAAAQAIGLAPTSYNYLLKKARAGGFIKMKGSGLHAIYSWAEGKLYSKPGDKASKKQAA